MREQSAHPASGVFSLVFFFFFRIFNFTWKEVLSVFVGIENKGAK